MDVEEIANTLEKLVSDRGLRARYGLTAQEFTLSHFGVKRLVNDRENFYKKLVSSRAKP